MDSFDDAPIRHVDETDHAADLYTPEYWEDAAGTSQRLVEYYAEAKKPGWVEYHAGLVVRFREHAARLRRAAA